MLIDNPNYEHTTLIVLDMMVHAVYRVTPATRGALLDGLQVEPDTPEMIEEYYLYDAAGEELDLPRDPEIERLLLKHYDHKVREAALSRFY